MDSYTPNLSRSCHILEKRSLQNKSTQGKALIFLIKNSSIDNSFSVTFGASVDLVTYLNILNTLKQLYIIRMHVLCIDSNVVLKNMIDQNIQASYSL